MTIIQKKTADLIPYEKNPRKNDEAVEKVAASIREFGFKVPIVIDKDNVIVAGHTRLKAAEAAGMDEVPCIVADDLTDEQIKAFRLADNKTAEFASWDFDLLTGELQDITDIDMSEFGFDFSEIDEEEEIIEDDYDFKENVEHRATAGDVFQLGEHRLMCGDSSSPDDVEKLSGGGASKDGLHRSAVWSRNRRQEQDAPSRPAGWTADREHHRGHFGSSGTVRTPKKGIYQSPGTQRGGLLVLCNSSTGR